VWNFITHADSSRWGRVFTAVYLSVCLVSARYLKSRCSWDHLTWHSNVSRWVLETHLFWVQKVKVTSHKNCAGVGHIALWWVRASSCLMYSLRKSLCHDSRWHSRRHRRLLYGRLCLCLFLLRQTVPCDCLCTWTYPSDDPPLGSSLFSVQQSIKTNHISGRHDPIHGVFLLEFTNNIRNNARKRGKAQRVAHPACANSTERFLLTYRLVMLVPSSEWPLKTISPPPKSPKDLGVASSRTVYQTQRNHRRC